jgi:hypothetical protein
MIMRARDPKYLKARDIVGLIAYTIFTMDAKNRVNIWQRAPLDLYRRYNRRIRQHFKDLDRETFKVLEEVFAAAPRYERVRTVKIPQGFLISSSRTEQAAILMVALELWWYIHKQPRPVSTNSLQQ